MNGSSGRRQFLRLMVLSGAVVGCRRALATPEATLAPIIITATPPVAIFVDLRFTLENDAISYQPHPEGCDRTTLQGGVYDASGVGLVNIDVQVWDEESGLTASAVTNEEGAFRFDVTDGLSDQTYFVQLLSADGNTQLSDVITAQALPSCEHNLIVVNFVAATG